MDGALPVVRGKLETLKSLNQLVCVCVECYARACARLLASGCVLPGCVVLELVAIFGQVRTRQHADALNGLLQRLQDSFPMQLYLISRMSALYPNQVCSHARSHLL